MGKKSSHGSGSVYKKGNKYQGQYYKPDGSRGYVSAKTKTDCRAKLRQAMADADRGVTFDSKTTLGEYLDSWLPRIKGKGIRQRTWERYEQIVRIHLKPALGHIKLKNLKWAHADKLYSDKLETASNRTVHYIHVTLHKALDSAVKDGLIPSNVTDGARLKQDSGYEINPLTPEQADTFLECARGDRFETLYLLALKYGLRQGELLGLKWQDVDLNNRTIKVRRTMSESRAGRIEEDTKSGKDRVIRLSEAHTDALRSYRAASNGSPDNGRDELVFATTSGTAVNSSNLINRSFKPILKAAELPDIRFHDLRHTCATIRIMRGQPLHRVSKLLGHASIAITADIYVHDDGEDDDYYAN